MPKWFMFIMAMCGMISSASHAQNGLKHILPDEIRGWRGIEPAVTYDRKNLYEYIDGGAELYLSYNFKKMISRIYQKENQPDIIADVFDMGDSYSAFGLFMHGREFSDNTFGQGSEHVSGMLQFWKDRWFVSILASPETELSRKAISELAHHISQQIPHTGPLPRNLRFIPEKDLLPNSIRFFRHHAWLNSYYFIADRNILQIDETTEAVFAKYNAGEGDHPLLLVVSYPDTITASAAFNEFRDGYLPELHHQEFVKIEDGTWCGCIHSQKAVAIIFDARNPAYARELLTETRRRMQAAQ